MRKNPARKKSKKWLRRRIIVYGTAVSFAVVIGFTIYCLYLHRHIEERFSGRRWSIPSEVFSSTTVIYPGLTLNNELFFSKLQRLGYRDVDVQPRRPGEMRRRSGVLEIFLHDLHAPQHTRPGFPLRISLTGNRIDSLQCLKTRDALALVEIEPEEIMSFFGPERERRHLVAFDQVPQHLTNAILAAEDIRFYEHHGVDPLGILRAAYVNLRNLAIKQGGSTITQQLSKSYFLTPERTLSRKFKELIISVMMEGMYEKDDILEIYLNEIYFGQRGSVSINGVGQASLFYFGKPVNDLDLAESAVLAGLIRAPNYYSPYIDIERCRNRRDQVLHAMFMKQLIPSAALTAALQAPLEPVGFAAYRKQAPYFIDYLSEQLVALYPAETLTALGLSIYTTLDTQVQQAAEAALEKGLQRIEQEHPALLREEESRRLQGAVIVMQPKTGYILAMVGGRDYSVSQFNRITQAHRQPGSAFKPFIFLSALDSFTPLSLLNNTPVRYTIDGKTWEPHNFKPMNNEQVTLRRALQESINLAAVDCAMRVGLENVVATVDTFEFSTPVKPFPSIALGAFEIIPLELARSYCVFAADGVLPYPLSLQDVVDDHGRLLERRHTTIKRVTSPEKAFIMSSLLRSVIKGGTGRSLEEFGIEFPVAAKTGTTNNYRDAWFVGYTPDILALVWVGFDNGEALSLTGAQAALPIWADLLKAIPEHVSASWFRKPPGVVECVICTETGLLATQGACPATMTEYFLSDHAPREECRLHQSTNPFQKMLQKLKDAVKRH